MLLRFSSILVPDITYKTHHLDILEPSTCQLSHCLFFCLIDDPILGPHVVVRLTCLHLSTTSPQVTGCGHTGSDGPGLPVIIYL